MGSSRQSRRSGQQRAALCVSILAVALSAFSIYEAHQSRLGAARQAQATMDAQLHTWELEERPFLTVSPLGVRSKVIKTHGKGNTDLFIDYKIAENGRSQALDPKGEITLGAYQGFRHAFNSATWRESLPPMFNETRSRTVNTIGQIGDTPFIELYGEMAYRDKLNQPHWSRFCFSAQLPKLPANGSVEAEFTDCPMYDYHSDQY